MADHRSGSPALGSGTAKHPHRTAIASITYVEALNAIFCAAEDSVYVWDPSFRYALIKIFLDRETHRESEAVVAIAVDDTATTMYLGDTMGVMSQCDISSITPDRLQQLMHEEAQETTEIISQVALDARKLAASNARKIAVGIPGNADERDEVEGSEPAPSTTPAASDEPDANEGELVVVEKLKWNAHSKGERGVTSITYIDGKDMIISCGRDCCVKLWATDGSEIGTFGQPRVWNLEHKNTWKHFKGAFFRVRDAMKLSHYLSSPMHAMMSPKRRKALWLDEMKARQEEQADHFADTVEYKRKTLHKRYQIESLDDIYIAQREWMIKRREVSGISEDDGMLDVPEFGERLRTLKPLPRRRASSATASAAAQQGKYATGKKMRGIVRRSSSMQTLNVPQVVDIPSNFADVMARGKHTRSLPKL